MANTAFGSGTPDDEYTSDAQAAAQAAADAQAAAEAAQAAAEAALAATLAALAAQVMDDHADVNSAGAAGGEFLRFSGGNWINDTAALDDLSDTSVAAPNVSDVLQFVGGVWTAQPLVALGFLPLSGGTLTGTLTLDASPNNPLEAATKQYVDGIAAPYDVGVYFDGKPGADEDVLKFVAVRSFFLAAALPLSAATATVAATGITTFNIQRDGVNIGTLQWAALATDATFTLASDEQFLTGEVLGIVAATVPDATLEDISITLNANLGTP